MQEAKGGVHFRVPSKGGAVVFPKLIELRDQARRALSTCRPLAQLNLTELNVDQRFMLVVHRVGVAHDRRTQAAFVVAKRGGDGLAQSLAPRQQAKNQDRPTLHGTILLNAPWSRDRCTPWHLDRLSS